MRQVATLRQDSNKRVMQLSSKGMCPSRGNNPVLCPSDYQSWHATTVMAELLYGIVAQVPLQPAHLNETKGVTSRSIPFLRSFYIIVTAQDTK